MTEIQNSNNTKVNMENTDDFNVLVVKPGKLIEYSWKNEDYINKILKHSDIELVTLNKDTYIELTTKYLEIAKYTNINVNVLTEIFADEPDYLYEIMYVDLVKHNDYQSTTNEMASLININGEVIFSNAIVMKTYIPSLSNVMKFVSMTHQDLERILYNRVHTNVVIYSDDEFSQKTVYDLEYFAKSFFEEEYYKKVEIAFLAHNINIWYVSELGKDDVCGKLVNDKIEKCIIFTMNTQTIRGNITLDEVSKIIKLSNIMNDYTYVDEPEEKDALGRTVIKNKYRILDNQLIKYFFSISK